MRTNQNKRLKPTAGKAAELAEHRAAKLIAEKRLLDLRYKRESGELIPVEDVRREWSDTIIKLRQKINGFELPLSERARMLKGIAEVLAS
jgi:hypothetical protein